MFEKTKQSGGAPSGEKTGETKLCNPDMHSGIVMWEQFGVRSLLTPLAIGISP